jgi:hypothetical protein
VAGYRTDAAGNYSHRNHKGEAAAIALAVAMHPDLVLIDDRSGIRARRDNKLCKRCFEAHSQIEKINPEAPITPVPATSDG